MNTYVNKSQKSQDKAISRTVFQKHEGGPAALRIVDNRPETLLQRKLQEAANNSKQAIHLKAFQEMANANPPVNGGYHQQPKAGNLSASRKAGTTNISEHSINDSKVQYNAARPAQLHTNTYEHTHDAWPGMVKAHQSVPPTTQMKEASPVTDEIDVGNPTDNIGIDNLKTNASPIQMLAPDELRRMALVSLGRRAGLGIPEIIGLLIRRGRVYTSLHIHQLIRRRNL